MTIRFLRQAHKFIKRADSQLKAKIQTEIIEIADNPYKNPRLKGKFRNIYIHHFTFANSQYRIAYTIENQSLLIIIAIKTRENFYKVLEIKI